MFAVKILHGYITPQGTRTRIKTEAKIFHTKYDAEQFADKIGGRIKQLEWSGR